MNRPDPAVRPTLAGHVRIARFDHWIKNVFVLPGVVVALGMSGHAVPASEWIVALLAGLVAAGLIASSNYTLNEVLDAPYDRRHPTKCRRPVPSGQVHVGLALVQWIVLMLTGLAIARAVSTPLAVTLAALWVMGILYNVRPLRTKDIAYLDVVSEAVNNPLRFLAGWFIVRPDAVPPASLLLSYWGVGCFFMALKRFAEYRDIGSAQRAAAYRRSFAHYTAERLLVSVVFYASFAMLFFGAFIVRYRLELILAFPFVALVMATYVSVALKPGSAAQAPEKLYRERGLLVAIVACAVVIAVLFFVDVPALHRVFPAAIRSLGDF